LLFVHNWHASHTVFHHDCGDSANIGDRIRRNDWGGHGVRHRLMGNRLRLPIGHKQIPEQIALGKKPEKTELLCQHRHLMDVLFPQVLPCFEDVP
jgi:hypothetical protein